MERDECDATPYCPNYDFNSHAHVERDSFDIRQIVNFKISTHTLTWSVTQPDVRIDKSFDISTHTLTWSVTRIWTK